MDQICKMGSCVQAPPAPFDAGSPIMAPDGGSTPPGSVDASVGPEAGAGGDGGNGEQFGGNSHRSSGCGCSMVTGGEGGAALLLAVGIGAVLRRRRRARSSPS
jgi:MYXO-CTERM domain-containing protein